MSPTERGELFFILIEADRIRFSSNIGLNQRGPPHPLVQYYLEVYESNG